MNCEVAAEGHTALKASTLVIGNRQIRVVFYGVPLLSQRPAAFSQVFCSDLTFG